MSSGSHPDHHGLNAWWLWLHAGLWWSGVGSLHLHSAGLLPGQPPRLPEPPCPCGHRHTQTLVGAEHQSKVIDYLDWFTVFPCNPLLLFPKTSEMISRTFNNKFDYSQRDEVQRTIFIFLVSQVGVDVTFSCGPSVFQLLASTSLENPTLRKMPSGETPQTLNCLVSSTAASRLILSCLWNDFCSSSSSKGKPVMWNTHQSYWCLSCSVTFSSEFNYFCDAIVHAVSHSRITLSCLMVCICSYHSLHVQSQYVLQTAFHTVYLDLQNP